MVSNPKPRSIGNHNKAFQVPPLSFEEYRCNLNDELEKILLDKLNKSRSLSEQMKILQNESIYIKNLLKVGCKQDILAYINFLLSIYFDYNYEGIHKGLEWLKDMLITVSTTINIINVSSICLSAYLKLIEKYSLIYVTNIKSGSDSYNTKALFPVFYNNIAIIDKYFLFLGKVNDKDNTLFNYLNSINHHLSDNHIVVSICGEYFKCISMVIKSRKHQALISTEYDANLTMSTQWVDICYSIINKALSVLSSFADDSPKDALTSAAMAFTAILDFLTSHNHADSITCSKELAVQTVASSILNSNDNPPPIATDSLSALLGTINRFDPLPKCAILRAMLSTFESSGIYTTQSAQLGVYPDLLRCILQCSQSARVEVKQCSLLSLDLWFEHITRLLPLLVSVDSLDPSLVKPLEDIGSHLLNLWTHPVKSLSFMVCKPSIACQCIRCICLHYLSFVMYHLLYILMM